MKCCHCSRNAFTSIGGAALCLSCHTDFQYVSNNQVSSAFQLRQGSDIADSILKARASLIEHQIINEKTTDVNNYTTHNNITVQGNNSGILNTGKAQIKNNSIGIADASKSNLIVNGLKQIAKLCLQILKRFFW